MTDFLLLIMIFLMAVFFWLSIIAQFQDLRDSIDKIIKLLEKKDAN